MSRFLTVACLMVCGLAQLGGAPSEESAAAIVDSGSTNRPGFRIVVDRAGAAEMTVSPRRFGPAGSAAGPLRRTLPQDLVDKFYADIEAAKPFASLPVVHCAKSASFGSSRKIVLGNDQTPDLTCGHGDNAVMRNLIEDTNRIVDLMR